MTDYSYENFLKRFQSEVEKSGRSLSEVYLIAVSKTKPTEQIKEVYQKGHRHFGENYVQEAIEKKMQLKDLQIIWHFIGGLQKNKVKNVVGVFDLIHSVDSVELAKKISGVALQKKVLQKCLLQINIGDETSKGGFSAPLVLEKRQELFALPNLVWQGLMAMPPIADDEGLARSYLKQTKQIFEQIKDKLDVNSKKEWQHLSMGTSHDFHLAIQEGATMIRVGTLIFGDRKKGEH